MTQSISRKGQRGAPLNRDYASKFIDLPSTGDFIFGETMWLHCFILTYMLVITAGAVWCEESPNFLVDVYRQEECIGLLSPLL